jgi:NADH-quinone oxidoreductase subunit D
VTLKTEPIVLNLGPQHPSTHGVARMRATIEGEVITDVELVLGYLHRGIEKLAEARTWTQVIPLTDRLDYLASMTNNWAYVLGVEKLLGIKVPERAEYIRVIMGEFMRLSSHLLSVGFLLNDLGSYFTPLMYAVREREKILDLFEMICGQRLTYNYYRIGGVSHDITAEFIDGAKRYVREMPGYIRELDRLLTENEVLLARVKGVGVLSKEMAVNSSASGPVLRASGVKWDVRKNDPYSVYDRFQFDIPVLSGGDCLDRYLIRMEEMRQSVRILEQALAQLPAGEYCAKVPLIFHAPRGEAYGHIEAPRGDLGFYIVSDGSIAPYRLHIRPSTLLNLTTLKQLSVGWKIADLVVIFGSIDVVLGEMDR